MYHLKNVSQEPSTTAFIKAIRMKPESYESVANIYTVPRINLSSCASIPPTPSWLGFCSGIQLNFMSVRVELFFGKVSEIALIVTVE
jgi:hypothetical protein